MPVIRNSSLIKRFTDYFKLKTNDFLDSEAGRMLVPVVMLPVPPNIIEISDVVVNDSDKIITVPSGKQWKILSGHITLVTTATIGTRNMVFEFRNDASAFHYRMVALNGQIASTTEEYSIGNFGDVSESRAGQHTIPIPVNLILTENSNMRIFDIFAIDAAADDLTIRLIVEETDITGE